MKNELTPIEKRNKLISAVSTLCVMGLILLVCALMGMKYPDPPLPEEGVEVNLGNSDFGLGDAQQPDESDATAPVTPPMPSTGENIATQTAPSAAINTTPKPNTRPNDVKEPPVKPNDTKQPETPKTNPNALFKGKKNTSNGGSQGVTQGAGDQGKQGGDPNSNRYDGQPGNGGAGYSLSGRKASSLPLPNYNSQKEGKVVVKIFVNQDGKVTNATAPEKGSTILEGALVQRAIAAAKQAHFNADPNASETQVGTITYVFRTK